MARLRLSRRGRSSIFRYMISIAILNLFGLYVLYHLVPVVYSMVSPKSWRGDHVTLNHPVHQWEGEISVSVTAYKQWQHYLLLHFVHDLRHRLASNTTGDSFRFLKIGRLRPLAKENNYERLQKRLVKVETSITPREVYDVIRYFAVEKRGPNFSGKGDKNNNDSGYAYEFDSRMYLNTIKLLIKETYRGEPTYGGSNFVIQLSNAFTRYILTFRDNFDGTYTAASKELFECYELIVRISHRNYTQFTTSEGTEKTLFKKSVCPYGIEPSSKSKLLKDCGNLESFEGVVAVDKFTKQADTRFGNNSNSNSIWTASKEHCALPRYNKTSWTKCLEPLMSLTFIGGEQMKYLHGYIQRMIDKLKPQYLDKSFASVSVNNIDFFKRNSPYEVADFLRFLLPTNNTVGRSRAKGPKHIILLNIEHRHLIEENYFDTLLNVGQIFFHLLKLKKDYVWQGARLIWVHTATGAGNDVSHARIAAFNHWMMLNMKHFRMGYFDQVQFTYPYSDSSDLDNVICEGRYLCYNKGKNVFEGWKGLAIMDALLHTLCVSY